MYVQHHSLPNEHAHTYNTLNASDDLLLLEYFYRKTIVYTVTL